MIEMIAIALISVGIFFIIRGLTEKHEKYERLINEERNRRIRKIEMLEEMEEEYELKPKKKVKTGGVVLIGPVPIVFGDSKYAVYALILAIVLMLLSIGVMFSLIR